MSTAPSEFEALSAQAGTIFTPSAPVHRRQLFAGRFDQISALLDAIHTKGQHAIIYGERGVGKTSLVSIVPALTSSAKSGGFSVRVNCMSTDTFASLWVRALDEVKFAIEQKSIGFTPQRSQEIGSLAGRISGSPTPDEVVSLLRRLDAPFVFSFDEFDQLRGNAASQAFAETIKALSDYAVPATIVLVGVGDNVSELIESHASIERALVQIRMPRMEAVELEAIVTTALSELGMNAHETAKSRIVRLSQGLPHYVHLLGLYAARQALIHHSKTISSTNVDAGTKTAVAKASQTVTESYLKATSSRRKDSLFRPVLLACALTRTDDLGYFRPAWVKPPLKAIGHELDTPAFASHLNKFASEERGAILQKTGSDRHFRYRFRNPLMQPYVIMRGLADKFVEQAAIDTAFDELEDNDIVESDVDDSAGE